MTQCGKSAKQSGGRLLCAGFSFRIFYCQFLDIFVSLELEGIGAGGRSRHISILRCIFRGREEIKVGGGWMVGGGLSKYQEER